MTELKHLIKVGKVIINLDNVCRIEHDDVPSFRRGQDSTQAEVFFVDGTSKKFKGGEAKELLQNFRFLS